MIRGVATVGREMLTPAQRQDKMAARQSEAQTREMRAISVTAFELRGTVLRLHNS